MKRLLAVLAILAVGSTIMFFIYQASCANKIEDDQGGQFGIDRVKGGDAKPVAFDGKKAMKHLQAICDLGPRISGTKSMRKQQKIIKSHFEELGAKVQTQTFMAKQNSVAGKVEMTNIIVPFYPEKKRRVILCTHYDTRPIADQEKDPRDWKKPFVSANDGGSGVALLMELGRHMKDLKTNVGVDFVFFDGEEYIYKTEGPGKDDYFIGSKHFAQTWYKDKNRCDYAAAILMDMIAGHNPEFPVEIHSWRRSPKLVEEVWTIAKEQKARSFLMQEGHLVLDDHTSLHAVGIPAIDIIDFDYRHWHKLSDTPENCSAESMEQVAKVLSVWLQRTK